MSSLLLILLSAALASIIALTGAARWRPFSGADVYRGALALAVAALLVIPATTLVSWILDALVLGPSGLTYLRTLTFVAVLIIVVSAVELGMRRRLPLPPQQPGFMLVLTANGVALGAALLAQTRLRSLFDAIAFSVGAALAFALLLLALASLYDRMRGADAPQPFRNAPLALITTGLIALGFMGFVGLVAE